MALSLERLRALFIDLQSLPEEELQRKFFFHEYGGRGSEEREQVEDWVRIKMLFHSERRAETALTTAVEANVLAREANSVAVQARSDARRANVIAIAATILNAAIAISAVIIEYSKP